MNEKIKTGPLRFPAKENFNMEKVLSDWPVVLQYDVKGKYRVDFWKVLGHEVLSLERSLNQPEATRVCIRTINQSNRSISACLLFPFFRAFISRSYENRSNYDARKKTINIFKVSFWAVHISISKLYRKIFHKL